VCRGFLGALVVGVAAGALLGVEVLGWDELGEVVGAEADLPVALVHDLVVVAALCRAVDYAVFGVEVVVVHGFCRRRRGIIRIC
jgi:hypothetical protein